MCEMTEVALRNYKTKSNIPKKIEKIKEESLSIQGEKDSLVKESNCEKAICITADNYGIERGGGLESQMGN